MKKITLILLVLSFGLTITAQESNYKIKNLDTNTKYSDFGVSYVGENEAIFASSRTTKVVRTALWDNALPFLDLFKGKNALGEYIEITGINFKVVGIYTDPGGEREETRIFIPLTTAQRVYNAGDKLRSVAYALHQSDNFEEALAASEAFTTQLEADLKQKHIVSPTDKSAININNSLENAKRFYDLIGMIRGFFWGVGICTIIAGVVGVSNIMLIIVKERTKELGIRKAVGATPKAIVAMIMQESIFITAISGYAGLLFGVGILKVVGPSLEKFFILNPGVSQPVVIGATVVLILAGMIAGYLPAKRAANIKPVVALSAD